MSITFDNIKIIQYSNRRIWYILSNNHFGPGFVLNGKNYFLHRTDGPAIEFNDNDRLKWT